MAAEERVTATGVPVRHFSQIPDLVEAYKSLPDGLPRLLLESGDARGHSYLCAGRSSADLILESDAHHRYPRGESIRLLRERFAHDPESIIGTFTGGGAGFVAYDFARTLESLPEQTVDDIGLPHLHLFFPSVILVADHESRTATAYQVPASGGYIPEEPAGWIEGFLSDLDSLPGHSRTEVMRPKTAYEPGVPEGWKSNLSEEEFVRGVRRAIEYIRAGDIFQVNLSLRLATPFEESPVELYRALRETNPSPYMTLLELDDLAVVGASPEQLLRVEGERVATRPIAGTRRRGRTSVEEAEKERELLASEKERAEHLMLVDLERNDIGRVAAYGSVEVDEFMTIERYSHVVHIVSNVVGRLAEGKDRFDALGALFPGGTITGAPKVRAMEIIEEIEPHRRGIYTGSIGWIDSGPSLEMNIAIRSILLKGGKAYVQGGAGIVADSVGELEYRESLKKLAASIEAVESTRGGRKRK